MQAAETLGGSGAVEKGGDMDEGRESNQTRVGADILGRDHPVLIVYTVRDPHGDMLFTTIDRIDARLFVGSRMEH